MMQRFGAYGLALTALSGFLWVTLGAMTGHYTMPEPEATYFAKAHRYHIAHTLAMMLVLQVGCVSRWRLMAFAAWFAGMVFFSGSLYVMAMLGWALNYVVPIGGVAFLLGWALFFFDCLLMAQKGGRSD